MPVRLVEAKFYGRRNRRGNYVFSARSSFFTIRGCAPQKARAAQKCINLSAKCHSFPLLRQNNLANPRRRLARAVVLSLVFLILRDLLARLLCADLMGDLCDRLQERRC